MAGVQLKYFVLNPASSNREHANASREAMLRYSISIRPTNPELADDLAAWIINLDMEEAGDAAD